MIIFYSNYCTFFVRWYTQNTKFEVIVLGVHNEDRLESKDKSYPPGKAAKSLAVGNGLNNRIHQGIFFLEISPRVLQQNFIFFLPGKASLCSSKCSNYIKFFSSFAWNTICFSSQKVSAICKEITEILSNGY